MKTNLINAAGKVVKRVKLPDATTPHVIRDGDMTYILVDTYTLNGLAAATGGRVVMLRGERSVGEALNEITGVLGRQYYLAYHASSNPGYHQIEVQVPGRSVEVRTREGYRVD